MSSCIKGCKLIITLLLLIEKNFVSIHGWRPYSVYVDEVITETYTPKCMVNSSVTYPSLLNMNINVLETIKSTYSHIELFLESTDGKYDMELMNRTVDMCRLYRDFTYEPILQVGMRLSRSASSFLTSCFIKKGNYTLKNLQLNVEKLPPVFPEKSGFYSQLYLLDKTHPLFKVKLFFSVNKVFKKD